MLCCIRSTVHSLRCAEYCHQLPPVYIHAQHEKPVKLYPPTNSTDSAKETVEPTVKENKDEVKNYDSVETNLDDDVASNEKV